MRNNSYLFSVFLLSASFLFYGQEKSLDTINFKKLKVISPENQGKIYLKTKLSNSGNIHVYLINRSQKTLRTAIGPASIFKFSKEARDTNGNWQPIDHGPPLFICGTGLYSGRIKPDHYTWQTLYKWKYKGDFKTEVRFLHSLNDSITIISNSQTVSINPDLFLSYYERRFKHIDLLLLSDTISKNHRIKLMRLKIQYSLKHRTIEETIALSKDFTSQFPDSEIGKYLLAIHYMRYISKHRKNLSSVEMQVLLSRAIEVFALIKRDNKLINKARNRQKRYEELLLSKKDWLSLPMNFYQEINGQYYAAVTTDEKEVVRVRFRQE